MPRRFLIAMDAKEMYYYGGEYLYIIKTNDINIFNLPSWFVGAWVSHNLSSVICGEERSSAWYKCLIKKLRYHVVSHTWRNVIFDQCWARQLVDLSRSVENLGILDIAGSHVDAIYKYFPDYYFVLLIMAAHLFISPLSPLSGGRILLHLAVIRSKNCNIFFLLKRHNQPDASFQSPILAIPRPPQSSFRVSLALHNLKFSNVDFTNWILK